MSSVLITGAGGFIGRRVAKAATEAGLEVHLTGRRPLPGRSVTADLSRSTTELPRVDAVFHLAGEYAGAGYEALARVDLAIAHNLIEWGSKTGVRQWVFASAAEVYGPCQAPATETAPVAPHLPYGRVKAEIERLFASFAKELPEARVVVLRIGEVYGQEGTLIQELTARLRSGFCPWLGSGRIPLSFVHVDDVARASVAGYRAARPGLSVFNVADDEPVEWRIFLDHLAGLLGARRAVSLPMAVSLPYAALSTAIDRLRRRRPTVTRNIVTLLTTAKPMSNARLRGRLGFELLYPNYRRGLDQVVNATAHRDRPWAA